MEDTISPSPPEAPVMMKTRLDWLGLFRSVKLGGGGKI